MTPYNSFTMGWELTRWIVSLRSVQLMGSFIPGALNGWLLYFIDHKGIPLAESIIILQILVCCSRHLLITVLGNVSVCLVVRGTPFNTCKHLSCQMDAECLITILDHTPFLLHGIIAFGNARLPVCSTASVDDW